MKNVMNHTKKQLGLSLIEVLVTITITSIGLMGLVSLQMQAVRSTTDSGNRSQAVWLFNDIINRIHANEASSQSYTTQVDCAANPPATCSAYHTGTAAGPAVANCTGPQMAAWDLFEVACGSPKNDAPGQIFISNSIDYLPQAQLTITCANGAGCANGDPLNITLTWRAKSDNESITGAQRTANSGTYTITDTITP